MQLLSKIIVGGQELKNRLVMAPMTRARYVTSCSSRLDRKNLCTEQVCVEFNAAFCDIHAQVHSSRR